MKKSSTIGQPSSRPSGVALTETTSQALDSLRHELAELSALLQGIDITKLREVITDLEEEKKVLQEEYDSLAENEFDQRGEAFGRMHSIDLKLQSIGEAIRQYEVRNGNLTSLNDQIQGLEDLQRIISSWSEEGLIDARLLKRFLGTKEAFSSEALRQYLFLVLRSASDSSREGVLKKDLADLRALRQRWVTDNRSIAAGSEYETKMFFREESDDLEGQEIPGYHYNFRIFGEVLKKAVGAGQEWERAISPFLGSRLDIGSILGPSRTS